MQRLNDSLSEIDSDPLREPEEGERDLDERRIEEHPAIKVEHCLARPQPEHRNGDHSDDARDDERLGPEQQCGACVDYADGDDKALAISRLRAATAEATTGTDSDVGEAEDAEDQKGDDEIPCKGEKIHDQSLN